MLTTKVFTKNSCSLLFLIAILWFFLIQCGFIVKIRTVKFWLITSLVRLHIIWAFWSIFILWKYSSILVLIWSEIIFLFLVKSMSRQSPQVLMIFFWLGIRWILLTSGIISGPLKLLFFLFIVDWCSISFIIRSFFNTVIRGIIEFFFLILEYRILIRSFIINIRFGRFPRLVMICLIFLLRDLLRFISVSIISSLWRCLFSRFVCIVTFLRFLLRLVYISLFI